MTSNDIRRYRSNGLGMFHCRSASFSLSALPVLDREFFSTMIFLACDTQHKMKGRANKIGTSNIQQKKNWYLKSNVARGNGVEQENLFSMSKLSKNQT